MKTTRPQPAQPKLKSSKAEILKFQRVSVSAFQRLTSRLADAEETLRAIRSGEVDSVMVAGKEGSQVFTLDGAEHAYRVLIESMNEGALTLTADKTILYANQCFARMVKCPLEQVMGGSLRRFLSPTDLVAVRRLLKRAAQAGSKLQAVLLARDGSPMPVLISIRPLPTRGDASGATISMVVTDLTEARRSEERLRALSHRLVDAQESERRRVALELHENISQLTYAILMRCDTLAKKLPARARASRTELLELRDLLDQATEDVRRIAHDLRPSALDDLGLLPVLRKACEQFGQRTHLPPDLAGVRTIPRLPAIVETALYRVLQEVLKNIEQHAHARHVTVGLRQQGGWVQLAISDDGIGFDPDQHPAHGKRKIGLGLLGLRERVEMVGGHLALESTPGHGTTIRARIPVADGPARPAG